MKIIHVLREYPAAFTCRPGRNDLMRLVGLTLADLFTPPAIPLPHERRIASERAGRGEIFGPEISPESLGAAKRRNAARCRNPCAGEDGQTPGVPKPVRERLRDQGVTP